MPILKKKENQFLILTIIFFIFYLFNPELFWKITVTPFISSDVINKQSGELAIISNKFYDLRYLQYISGYFESINLPSNELYNLYKQHDSEMVINYPRIWIAISHYINIKSETVLYSFYFLFFILYSNIFFQMIKKTNSYFICYLFFCGANLLLLERGNVDLLLITLVFYTFLNKNKFLNYFGFLLVSFLKIYPAFSLFFFLKDKRSIIVMLILSAIFFIYLLITKNDIINISLVNPKNGNSSYGFLSIIINFKNYLNINLEYFYILIINLFIIFVVYYFLLKKKLNSVHFKDTKIFLLGGGIFVFTFLINTHHDYRMMFLIFCLPLILNIENKNFKILSLILIILSLEIQKLIFIFGFWGGAINSMAKLILFYVITIIYMDIINKLIKKNFIPAKTLR